MSFSETANRFSTTSTFDAYPRSIVQLTSAQSPTVTVDPIPNVHSSAPTDNYQSPNTLSAIGPREFQIPIEVPAGSTSDLSGTVTTTGSISTPGLSITTVADETSDSYAPRPQRCPTSTTCSFRSTLGRIDLTMTVPLVDFAYATLVVTTVSGSVGAVSTLFPQQTISTSRNPWPTPTSAPLTVIPATITDSHGNALATLQVSPQIIPNFSTATNTQGSVTTVLYNLTVPFSPEPSPFDSMTTWTTNTAINGSTVPLVAAQTCMLTVTQGPGVLLPGTVVPLDSTSSISIESIPSATSIPTQVGSLDKTKVVGAIVGALLVLNCLGVLI
ncbi:hypothetical protein RhiLY_04814 [Ceratobasidium sp. AG-Ba]|nr:hypothetical protein RhiLY_04814 [Ceratobasidium sp. AG-Ba]